MTHSEKFAAFKALHVPGNPLLLANIWDAGSAKAVALTGAKALATGSWSVAAAHGFRDGEQLPRDLALANLGRILAVVDVPVSIDLESGYGADPEGVAQTLALAAEAGAVGCNLEDSVPATGDARPLDEAVARLSAARRGAGADFFINARTDVFLQNPPELHTADMLESALERAHAYAEAGANGLFLPGLIAASLIEVAVARSPLPVNIMMMPGCPPVWTLKSLGVARISQAPGPYQAAMAALTELARTFLIEEDA